ncbi:MAG: hypothetical protein K8T20_04985 [Planctomycetes bacterium]|nr:hypothetical protein [Planctomycetota bacterium]
MKLAFPLLALVIAGCASPPPPAFSLSQEEARALAKKEGRPLLVLSVVGDLDGRL